MSVSMIYVPEDCGPTIWRQFETLGSVSEGVELPEPIVSTLNEATLDLELVLAVPAEAAELGLYRADVLARYVAAYNEVMAFCVGEHGNASA